MKMNRNMSKVTVLFVAWAFVLGIALGPQPARSIDLGGAIGDLVKVFGIAWVVNHFDKQIDRGINTFLQQHEAAIEGQTKVVPILRVGTKSSTAIGAAQVMGPTVQVRKVQAVAELQLDIGSLRGRALIPISTKDAKMGGIKGVSGVGVSANIKFPI
mgnify:CR=1 FL=1